MSETKKLVEKYMSDWHHSRFLYSQDYTPESAFLAGYRAAQERVKKLEVELQTWKDRCAANVEANESHKSGVTLGVYTICKDALKDSK